MTLISHTAPAERTSQLVPSGMAFVVGFFFSLRTAIVLIAVRLLNMEPSTGTAISISLNLLLFAVVCFHSLQPRRGAWQWMTQQASIRWVFVFLAFALCSLAWSATVSLLISLIYWCGMAADIATVMILLRDEQITAKAHALMKGFIWSTCLLSVVAWVMPAQPDLRLGDLDFFNANQIANLCAFSIFMCQYMARRGDGRWLFQLLLLSTTLLRSLSKTTLVAFLLCELAILVQDRSITKKIRISLFAGGLLVMCIFWGLFTAYYDVYTNTGNQAETLTGRTGIWAYVLDSALATPWLGHGFDSMWKVIPPFGPDRFEARHAENELLQQFYTYGVMGVLILIALYSSLLLKIRKLPRGPSRLILGTMLLFVVIRGLAEAEPFDLLLPLWVIVLVSVLAEQGIATGCRHPKAHPAQIVI